MTKEEIIKKYEMVVEGGELVAPLMGEDAKEVYEMLKAGLSALRPVSREQVEKAWRGEWIVQQGEYSGFIKKCSKCGFPISGWWGADKFCANCGAPMTDEAVEMVVERLEALYGKTD